jgi:hypothetical protein
MHLLTILLAPLAVADASNSTASWPHSVQPFFLSALNTALTPTEATYLGGLPVVVINHKQAGDGGKTEEKQFAALSMVKATNASCATFFYLNSLIDFSSLALHDKFVANGTWWLKTDAGAYVTHNGDKIFDMTVSAARDTWLATAQNAFAQPYISGVFVDKAGGFGDKDISAARMSAWNAGHAQMLHTLSSAAAVAKKRVILNNANIIGPPSAGQLFERWGQATDHDGLSLQQDIALLKQLTNASDDGELLSLVRAGGIAPGSATSSPPEVCAASLAAMLLAVEAPNAAFFACMPDFNVIHGWMNLNQNMIYDEYLGAPTGNAVVGPDGLITRAFAGAKVVLNPKSFTPARGGGSLNSGCVQWASGNTTGICPSTLPIH